MRTFIDNWFNFEGENYLSRNFRFVKFLGQGIQASVNLYSVEQNSIKFAKDTFVAIKMYDFKDFEEILLSQEIITDLLDKNKSLTLFKQYPIYEEEVLPVMNEIQFLIRMIECD